VALATTAGCSAAHQKHVRPLEAPSPAAAPSPSGEIRSPEERMSAEGERRCEGCPPRDAGRALVQTTGINALYGFANLARGQVTARVTPRTWWTNMQDGWEWDLDDFLVNQIGHPYQGSNYFSAGRSNGLNFFES